MKEISDEEIKLLIREGKQIEAIQLVKQFYEVDLDEARKYVHSMVEETPTKKDDVKIPWTVILIWIGMLLIFISTIFSKFFFPGILQKSMMLTNTTGLYAWLYLWLPETILIISVAIILFIQAVRWITSQKLSDIFRFKTLREMFRISTLLYMFCVVIVVFGLFTMIEKGSRNSLNVMLDIVNGPKEIEIIGYQAIENYYHKTSKNVNKVICLNVVVETKEGLQELIVPLNIYEMDHISENSTLPINVQVFPNTGIIAEEISLRAINETIVSNK